MFVGHIGAGLIARAIEPRLNLGVLLFAALFADLLLWLLVIAGVESFTGPQSADGASFFTFVFPYSHGLAASILWSALAGLAVWLLAGAKQPRSTKLAWVPALAVFSHFALDFVVHVPELPLLGEDSVMLGLGLWRNMPIALGVELVLAAIALLAYLSVVPLSRGRALLAGGLIAVTGAFTTAGPYIPGEPPPAAVLALSSLVIVAIVVSLGFAIEGRVGIMAAALAAPGVSE